MKGRVWVLMVTAIVVLAFNPPNIRAQEVTTLEYHPSATMSEVLSKQFVGKDVYLLLTSGRELRGKLQKVGNNVVHLSTLAGMEFFDAVVELKEIEGFKFRTKSGK